MDPLAWILTEIPQLNELGTSKFDIIWEGNVVAFCDEDPQLYWEELQYLLECLVDGDTARTWCPVV
jgi:hypothetical protein